MAPAGTAAVDRPGGGGHLRGGADLALLLAWQQCLHLPGGGRSGPAAGRLVAAGHPCAAVAAAGGPGSRQWPVYASACGRIGRWDGRHGASSAAGAGVRGNGAWADSDIRPRRLSDPACFQRRWAVGYDCGRLGFVFRRFRLPGACRAASGTRTLDGRTPGTGSGRRMGRPHTAALDVQPLTRKSAWMSLHARTGRCFVGSW